jgi:hypothetical protein
MFSWERCPWQVSLVKKESRTLMRTTTMKNMNFPLIIAKILKTVSSHSCTETVRLELIKGNNVFSGHFCFITYLFILLLRWVMTKGCRVNEIHLLGA